MNRIKNILFAFLFSPEALIAVVVIAFSYFFSSQAIALGKAIRSDAEVWKYLPGLTLIFAGAAINSSIKIRAPLESSSNKVLYQWPMYQLLVDRVYVGIFYGVASAAISLFIWIIGKEISFIVTASLFLAATLISAVTSMTMLLAQQRIRELLELNA
ncbi:hypothetical protein ACM9XD_05670 [Xanthomonas sacchari]